MKDLEQIIKTLQEITNDLKELNDKYEKELNKEIPQFVGTIEQLENLKIESKENDYE